MLSFLDYHTRFASISRQLGATLTPLSNHAWISQWGTEPFYILMSGLHGDEISGPLAILQWLESIERVAMRRSSLVPAFNGLFLVPLINDHGWDLGQRTWHDLDLNRSFNHNAPPFIKEIMDHLHSNQIALFLDFHEDGPIEHPYVFNCTADSHSLASELASALGTTLEPWCDPTEWETTSDLFVRRAGCPYSLTLETPSQWPLAKRIELNIKAIKWILQY